MTDELESDMKTADDQNSWNGLLMFSQSGPALRRTSSVGRRIYDDGGRPWPATAEVFLTNLTDNSIAYKLKTNRTDSFKVLPRAHGVVEAKRTISLILNWAQPPPQQNKMSSEESGAMLLLQTRFIRDDVHDYNAQTIWRDGLAAGDTTETKIAAEIKPTSAFDVHGSPLLSADPGGVAATVGCNERLITRAQIFLENSKATDDRQPVQPTTKEAQDCHQRIRNRATEHTGFAEQAGDAAGQTDATQNSNTQLVACLAFSVVFAVAFYSAFLVCFRFSLGIK